jgi:signal transduction histidine kinase
VQSRPRLVPSRLDAAIALVLVVAGLAQVAVRPFADPVVAVLYVVGSTAPLAWRRSLPVEAALVSTAFWVIPLDGYPIFGFVAVILQFYALGVHGPSTRVVALVSAVASVFGVVGTLLGPEQPVAAVGGVLVVVAPALAGRIVAHQREQNARLAQLTRELAAERRNVEQSAVAAERARIAQELHDVVGHELTLIAIQAEAAAMALDVAPERAAGPVETIRETAHRTLAEIRSTLETLSPEAEAPGLTERELVSLAERAEAAGVPNSLTMTGTPWHDQASVWLALNRILREYLTNAGKHAPGAKVDVAVDWRRDKVVLRASNPVPGREAKRATVGAGRGLTGIRHRAELLGGTFASATSDGRFSVEVALPAEPVRTLR